MAAIEPAFSIQGSYIVAAGRLVPNKNFGMLIEAFAQSGLPGSLVIMGEGPLRGALEARIMQLGLEGRVHLPGFLENPFRSEEHTSELQSLMRISYAVFCLKKKRKKKLQTRQQ